MGEISFSDNYNDMSDETGFQFEFYCEGCGDVWRTEYKRYLAGTTSGIFKTVGSLLGGLLGGAERVADQVSDAGYRSAHDKAFVESVEQAKIHFQRCRQCGNYFCNKCFNMNLRLCATCAPSIDEASNIAARQAEIAIAAEKAAAAVKSGKRRTDGNVICPSCGARVRSGKFCSECGEPMTEKKRCKSCDAELEGSPKFCPECGQRLS